MGEEKDGVIVGLHNWLQFYVEVPLATNATKDSFLFLFHSEDIERLIPVIKRSKEGGKLPAELKVGAARTAAPALDYLGCVGFLVFGRCRARN